MNFIPIKQLIVGEAYKLDSRNLSVGIWDGEAFHGIRQKFGISFMETELHYDVGSKYGTARATARLVPEQKNPFMPNMDVSDGGS